MFPCSVSSLTSSPLSSSTYFSRRSSIFSGSVSSLHCLSTTSNIKSRVCSVAAIACYAVLTSTTSFKGRRILPTFAVNAFSSSSSSYFATTTTLSNNNDPKTMPRPPYQYNRPGNNASRTPIVLDLSDLGKQILESKRKRDDAYDKSRKIQMDLIKVRCSIEETSATKEEITESLQQIQSSLVEAIDRKKNVDDANHREFRYGNLNYRVEEWCCLMAFHHFLTSNGGGGDGVNIFPPSGCNTNRLLVTDEEYLSGACMGLCQDLSRYAMGRATARDADSVELTRNLVQRILDYLLQFDFRNGFLRRKYDGTKYALKSLETLLYELSVTGASSEAKEAPAAEFEGENDSNDNKRKDGGSDDENNNDDNNPNSRLGGGEKEDGEENDNDTAITTTPATTVEEELTALRLRMEHRDNLREKLIKKCRDGQKLAKQAIYALHRNDYKKSASLIRKCEDCIIEELLPIVDEEPPLRSGSFAGVVEEYVEAKLFYVWLVGKPTAATETTEDDASRSPKILSSGAKGKILLPHEFGPIQLQPEEYLGGLCDLTGEIGRFAVQRGTARDFEGVGLCLETNSVILKSILLLEQSPVSINKKMDQLRRSVQKIERMSYEISLSLAVQYEVKTTTEDIPVADFGG